MTKRGESSEHSLCRHLWISAKRDAAAAGVVLPIKMTAMRSTPRQFYVQGLNDEGEYIKACCALDAKAKRIASIIEQRTKGVSNEGNL